MRLIERALGETFSGNRTPTAPVQQGEARPPTVADTLESLRDKIAALPEAERAWVARQISDYMLSPSADTGRAFAEAIAKVLGK